MVLCAVADGKIRLVQPPEDANIGDRVGFPDFEGEAATPQQMVKKKILESLAPMVGLVDTHTILNPSKSTLIS